MQVEVCDGAAHCTQIKQEKAGAAFLHISVTKQLSFLGSSERFAPQKRSSLNTIREQNNVTTVELVLCCLSTGTLPEKKPK